jgi:hypothetical protein
MSIGQAHHSCTTKAKSSGGLRPNTPVKRDSRGTFASLETVLRAVKWRRAGDSNSQGPRGPVDFKFLKSWGLLVTVWPPLGSNLRSMDDLWSCVVTIRDR